MSAAPTPLKTLLASSFLGWLFSSFILFAIFQLLANQSSHPFASDIVAMALMLSFYALGPSLLGAVILGSLWLPHAAKLGLRSLWSYVAAGVFRGAGAGAFVSVGFLAVFGFPWWSWAAIGVGFSAVIGAFTGWFVWLDLRPDRDAANPTTPSP